MIENNMQVTIMAKSEITTDVPEYKDLNSLFPSSGWNENRRIGVA